MTTTTHSHKHWTDKRGHVTTTIATAAAVELKRHSAFASCGKSVEAADRLVGALRNHLLEPEREGDVAPLRRWIQQYLSQP